MPLPNFWPVGEVRHLVRHYREVGREADGLYAILAGSEADLPSGSDAVFALARAIELAFAIDDLQAGLEVCEDVISRSGATPMALALRCTALAILGQASISVRPQGIVVMSALPGWAIPWPEATVSALRLGRVLMPAAFATRDQGGGVDLGPDGGDEVDLAPAAAETRPALVWGLRTSPEFAAIRALGGRPPADRGLAALQGLEVAYSDRLDLLRASRQWKLRENNGSVLDWPLLMLWLGFARGIDDPASAVPPPITPEAAFVRILAFELAGQGDRVPVQWRRALR